MPSTDSMPLAWTIWGCRNLALIILVMDSPYDNIVTFAEASDRNNKYHGYESHGMEGDVIIYHKNGDEGTPIIHRAILRVEPSQTTSPNRLATKYLYT